MTSKVDVFISHHMNSAQNIAEKICKELESIGISCWYAERDSDGPFARAIIQAIQECKVFLLILNGPAIDSEHILNEVYYAFLRFQNHENIHILPFQIEHCSLTGEMLYYAGRFGIVFGMTPDNLLQLQELTNRIKNLLNYSMTARVKNRQNSQNTARVPYKLITSLAYPDIHFTGRQSELALIREQLQKVDNKLFLVGIGGIGKSEIAKMYLKCYAKEYDNIQWIPFENSLEYTIANDDLLQIEGISRTNYPTDNQKQYAKRKLDILKRIATRNTLLIIDNFDVQDDLDLNSFCAGPYGIIFTTRFHQANNFIHQIDILPITDDKDLIEIFRSEYFRKMAIKDLETIRQIIHSLDCHTLTIRLVASAMQSQRITPTQMLSILEDKEYYPMRIGEKMSDMIFGRLRTVFRLSDLNENELYVMKNLSLFSRKGIDVTLFCEWCELIDYETVNSLVMKNWIQYDTVQDRMCLHPLIAELMREELQKDPDCCATMLKRFYMQAIRYIDANLDKDLKKKRQDSEIASSIVKRLPNQHKLRFKMLHLKIETEASFPPYEQVFTDCQILMKQSESLEEKLYAYSRISGFYLEMGEFEKSLHTANEGYSIVQNHNELSAAESHHRRVLLGRIIRANNRLGHFEKALSYKNEFYRIATDTYENGHSPDITRGWCELIIAPALINLGILDEGEATIRSAIKHFENVKNIWYKSLADEILAMFYAINGCEEEALRIEDNVYRALIPMCGFESLTIASIWNNKGKIYTFLGKTEEACMCWNRAIALYDRLDAPHYADIIRQQLEFVMNDIDWRPAL